MKLYLVSQNLNSGYDTYSDMVVCAQFEGAARRIHPSPYVTHFREGKWYGTSSIPPNREYETENDEYGSWIKFSDIDKLEVKYLGEASDDVKIGVVLSSFHAG